MAVDARCPNCEDNLGKVTENGTKLHCGNCGWSGPNRQLKEYYPKLYREIKREELEWEAEQTKKR